MIHSPFINQWGYSAGNWLTTQPAAAFGTQVTNGNGSYGSWVEVVSALAEHCYEIAIVFSAGNASTVNRQQIANIGIDPAGGTNYTTIIPDLICGMAANYDTTAAVKYKFPIFIPAGSTIAVQTNGNSASTINVAIRVLGKPSRPELVKTGSKVIAYGVAAPVGTAVTAGTASEGAWAELGTIAAGDNPFFWQYGFTVDTTGASVRMFSCDIGIGDATNKAVVIHDAAVFTTTVEAVSKGFHDGGYYQAKAGDKVYGRVQGNNTGANLQMTAYGVIG